MTEHDKSGRWFQNDWGEPIWVPTPPRPEPAANRPARPEPSVSYDGGANWAWWWWWAVVSLISTAIVAGIILWPLFTKGTAF